MFLEKLQVACVTDALCVFLIWTLQGKTTPETLNKSFHSSSAPIPACIPLQKTLPCGRWSCIINAMANLLAQALRSQWGNQYLCCVCYCKEDLQVYLAIWLFKVSTYNIICSSSIYQRTELWKWSCIFTCSCNRNNHTTDINWYCDSESHFSSLN